MAKRLFLHVGPHKTGTTSFQAYLELNATALEAQGFHVCRDAVLSEDRALAFQTRTNVYAIAHHLIRKTLVTPKRIAEPALNPDLPSRRALVERVNAWATALPIDNIIMSSEAFSFLRTREERKRLAVMTHGLEITPVAVLRNAEDWRRSWRQQLAKMNILTPTQHTPTGTIFDLGEDSWLTDHESLRQFYGPRGIYLDYETALRRDGSIIPSLMSAMGISSPGLTDPNLIWFNQAKSL